jgi:hypothetical protein
LSSGRWSEWRAFPDPRENGVITAPFGPGVYELREIPSGDLVLVGSSKNCAARMASLLPAPLGSGTRANDEKRGYVLANVQLIEYRTRACRSREEAARFERELLDNGGYRFES